MPAAVMSRLAVRVPAPPGVNVTLTVHFNPAARLVPHVFDALKSAAFAPLGDPTLIAAVALPPLLAVTVWALLLPPTAWLPNVSDEGDTVTFAVAFSIAITCPPSRMYSFESVWP